MWKCISRGFRETIERGLNFSRNNNVKIPNETQRTRYYQRCGNSAGFVQFYKNRFRCQYSCNGKSGTNEKENKQYGTQDSFDSWLGAVSYSSAIALGWVLSQPHRWKNYYAEKRWHLNNICPLKYLISIAHSQPVVPSTQVVLAGSNSDNEENTITYGPITADQALDEAANNFFQAHNRVYGEIENKKAVALLEGPEKDEQKAIQLFFAASKKGYIPAAYNLGQCYELGVGIKQDFHEAAKWYQKAADGGHANATYNLAVFYAHGWGGLKADTNRTRQLLEAAAALGQPDAAAALGLNHKKEKDPSNFIPDLPSEVMSLKEEPPGSPLNDISSDPNELFKLASSFENTPCEDSNQPYLVLQLYKMASDLGHSEAKTKYKILQAYDTVGLLSDYLCRGGKHSGCYSRLRFPTVF